MTVAAAFERNSQYLQVRMIARNFKRVVVVRTEKKIMKNEKEQNSDEKIVRGGYSEGTEIGRGGVVVVKKRQTNERKSDVRARRTLGGNSTPGLMTSL